MCTIDVRLLFQVFEYLILIGLSVVSIYLSFGAFKKYKSTDTNLAFSFEEVKEHPTIVICFSPENNEYVYGQNFHFNRYVDTKNFHGDKYLNTNVIQIGLNPNLGVQLTTLTTAYHGKCYKISPLETINEKSSSWYTVIKFHTKITNVPVCQLYFTSEANSLGIVRDYWYEGIPFMAEINPNAGQEVRLVEYEYNYLNEKSGCHETQSWYNCYAELAEKLEFEECSSKCLAHSVRECDQIMAFCQTNTSDWSCSNKHLRNLRKSVIKDKICPRSCHIREYEGKTHENSVLNRPKAIVFTYYFFPPYISFIYKEYILFDFLGLISSVGGTLGIFIGISILALISTCFSHLVSLIEKCLLRN